MIDRLIIAYGLIVLMTIGIAAAIWWNVHHSHKRTCARDRARQQKKYEQEQDSKPPSHS